MPVWKYTELTEKPLLERDEPAYRDPVDRLQRRERRHAVEVDVLAAGVDVAEQSAEPRRRLPGLVEGMEVIGAKEAVLAVSPVSNERLQGEPPGEYFLLTHGNPPRPDDSRGRGGSRHTPGAVARPFCRPPTAPRSRSPKPLINTGAVRACQHSLRTLRCHGAGRAGGSAYGNPTASALFWRLMSPVTRTTTPAG